MSVSNRRAGAPPAWRGDVAGAADERRGRALEVIELGSGLGEAPIDAGDDLVTVTAANAGPGRLGGSGDVSR